MNNDNLKNNKNRIRKITLNGVMLALILALQMANLPNLITGIAVNAIFVFVVLRIDVYSAVCLCFISPIGGIISGHVQPFMYPILPVIALGNLLYVVFFNILLKQKQWLRYLVPSLIKAIVIGGVGWLIVKFFIPQAVNWIALSVLGIQFFTSIIGVWAGERFIKIIQKK